METRLNKLSVTWSVHAVKCGHQAIVLQSLVITLLQQGPDVGAAPSLWQQPAIKLGCQHLRVVFEDGLQNKSTKGTTRSIPRTRWSRTRQGRFRSRTRVHD